MTNERKEHFGNKHFIMMSQYEHEKKFFYIRTEFVPNLKATIVTPKFYAKHDTHHGEIPDPAYLKAIEDAQARGPKDRNDDPETENQRYGWNVEPLIPLDKYDTIINHYHQTSPITTIEAEIYKATKNQPKAPPFIGIPFKL